VGIILSRLVFGHNPLVYISLGLTGLLWFILFKTRPGLNIRSVGENPSMADSLGVSVFSTRYVAVQVGGALAALAGAYFILGVIGVWTEGPAQQGQPITGGRGWIAIALVILGTWSPLRAILGAYLFGGVEAMQFTLQGLGFAGVSQFLAMLPYALAIFVLVAVSVETVRKRIGVPAALGVPYAREM
jgi:simple sugar transport system permease protein